MDESVYDVVVVGAGTAGLNAALVLGRARRRVAVVDAGEPRNAPAAEAHGFLTRDGTPPAELLAEGRREVAAYGVEMVDGRVERIDHGYYVRLAGGRVLKSRRVLVATGLRDELPEIPGIAERWGSDVLHCPYCHGYEVRDQALGVLGSSAGAVHQALLLRQWSDDVVLFAHTLSLSAEDLARLAARGVRVVEGSVSRLDEDGVWLASGEMVARSALFVPPLFVPHDELLTGLGCETGEDGWVRVDESGRTSVYGVWAAGNVTTFKAQLISAAAAGATAAIAINGDLVEEETERAAVLVG
jgi:thioredoxin reductase